MCIPLHSHQLLTLKGQLQVKSSIFAEVSYFGASLQLDSSGVPDECWTPKIVRVAIYIFITTSLRWFPSVKVFFSMVV